MTDALMPGQFCGVLPEGYFCSGGDFSLSGGRQAAGLPGSSCSVCRYLHEPSD